MKSAAKEAVLEQLTDLETTVGIEMNMKYKKLRLLEKPLRL